MEALLQEYGQRTSTRPSYGALQRASGNRITASSIWKLHTGFMDNPSLSALEALADIFECDLNYFRRTAPIPQRRSA